MQTFCAHPRPLSSPDPRVSSVADQKDRGLWERDWPSPSILRILSHLTTIFRTVSWITESINPVDESCAQVTPHGQNQAFFVMRHVPVLLWYFKKNYWSVLNHLWKNRAYPWFSLHIWRVLVPNGPRKNIFALGTTLPELLLIAASQFQDDRSAVDE